VLLLVLRLVLPLPLPLPLPLLLAAPRRLVSQDRCSAVCCVHRGCATTRAGAALATALADRRRSEALTATPSTYGQHTGASEPNQRNAFHARFRREKNCCVMPRQKPRKKQT
jgi:hypothetical protein